MQSQGPPCAEPLVLGLGAGKLSTEGLTPLRLLDVHQRRVLGSWGDLGIRFEVLGLGSQQARPPIPL